MPRGNCKVPSKVNVNGHKWVIQWVKQDNMGGKHRGECVYPERIIRISTSVKADKVEAWLYFLHEVRHAYQFETGLMQVLNKQGMEFDADGFASFITSLQAQGIL